MLWTSLAVQWLRLCTSNAGDTFQSLVREFRSHQLHGVSKRKRIMLFKKVTSSSKYNWFWGILVFFPTHWIRIRDRKQSPVHFTCLSIRKNIIYKFNILLWTASLCKVLEYSIFDIHTLAHTHTIWYCRLCQDLFNTREFQHTAYATNPYLLYVSDSY